MKKYVIYILVALAVSACIYPYDAEPAGEVPERLVISGDILIGEMTQVDLGYVMPLSTSAYELRKAEAPEATVTVESDNGQSYRGVRGKDGRYTVDTRNAPDNARYRLAVKLADDREYTSPWSGVNQAPEIVDLWYEVDDENMRLFCTLDGRDSLWNFCWDYEEVWEYHAYFMPDVLYINDTTYLESRMFKDYYYCWNTRQSTESGLASADGLTVNKITGNNFHSLSRSDNRMSYLYSIQLTVRGLSSDARVYMEHQRLMSNGTGDLFSPIPSEMRGNIRCVTNPDEQVVGFISVCERASHRIFINVSPYHKSRENPNDLLFFPEPDEDGNYNLDALYVYNSPVTFDGEAPTKTNVIWGPKRCVDCRVWGGTKTKPEWWPNDDE